MNQTELETVLYVVSAARYWAEASGLEHLYHQAVKAQGYLNGNGHPDNGIVAGEAYILSGNGKMQELSMGVACPIDGPVLEECET